eukprot:SAG31_NODE_9985_length_1201_cov_0.994555_1_plen_93_part_00
MSTARFLSWTKGLVVLITVVFTVWLVQNGASGAAAVNSQLAAFMFKMSELISTYKNKTRKEMATFVGAAILAQVLSTGLLIATVTEMTHWMS